MLVDNDNGNADLCDEVEVLDYALIKCFTKAVAISSPHQIAVKKLSPSTVYPIGTPYVGFDYSVIEYKTFETAPLANHPKLTTTIANAYLFYPYLAGYIDPSIYVGILDDVTYYPLYYQIVCEAYLRGIKAASCTDSSYFGTTRTFTLDWTWGVPRVAAGAADESLEFRMQEWYGCGAGTFCAGYIVWHRALPDSPTTDMVTLGQPLLIVDSTSSGVDA